MVTWQVKPISRIIFFVILVMSASNKTQVFQWWEFQKPGFMDLMQMPPQMGKINGSTPISFINDLLGVLLK